MKRRIIIAGMATFCAVMLYISSIGPASYAYYRLGWFSSHQIEVAYAPIKLIPKYRIFTAPMSRYIELWLGPGDCAGTGTGG
jgi:hypothetical protein